MAHKLQIYDQAVIVSRWLADNREVQLHSGHYTAPNDPPGGIGILRFRATVLTAYHAMKRRMPQEWTEHDLQVLESKRLLHKTDPHFFDWRDGDPEDPRKRFSRFQGLDQTASYQRVFAEGRFLSSMDPLFWSDAEHSDFIIYKPQIVEEYNAQRRAAEYVSDEDR